MTTKLPPLPVPLLGASTLIESVSGVMGALYTKDQMLEYGQQCRDEVLSFVMGVIKINQHLNALREEFLK